MAEEFGGGSLTALPIIETQAGDISAYIPTNVISITDGQIYLETEAFNSGFRPAVNAGLSVSRVGGAAQKKIMKKVAGQIRLDLAQYRELAAFAQFGSELDQATKEQLAQGERVREMLKQPQYEPMAVEDQVLIIYAATRKHLLKIATDKVHDYEVKLLEYTKRRRPELMELIREKMELTEDVETLMKEVLDEFTTMYLEETEA